MIPSTTAEEGPSSTSSADREDGTAPAGFSQPLASSRCEHARNLDPAVCPKCRQAAKRTADGRRRLERALEEAKDRISRGGEAQLRAVRPCVQ